MNTTMKRKRITTTTTTTNSSSQLSETTSTVAASSEFYLPDECWELICTFLADGNHRYTEYLSLACKRFLSITNRLRDSFTISDSTLPFIPTLFHRFPNLESLHITSFQGDLNALLRQISKFPLEDLESLELSNLSKFPSEGLRAFSKKITTLTSFACSNIGLFRNKDFFLISNCFPFLEELHLHLQHDNLSSQFIGIWLKAMFTVLPELRKIKLW
jgi:F-box/leucine-rich repeat protein 2/20